MVLQVHVKDQFEDQAAAAVVIGETGGASVSSGKGGTNRPVARATGVLPNTSAAPGTSVATIIALVALLLTASLVVGRAVTRRG
jgi:hypothetical protein